VPIARGLASTFGRKKRTIKDGPGYSLDSRSPLTFLDLVNLLFKIIHQQLHPLGVVLFKINQLLSHFLKILLFFVFFFSFFFFEKIKNYLLP